MCGLVDVVEDLGAVRDRELAAPGLEIEAERVQVRVRADAGIAEQVPRAADALAGLDDRVAALGVVLLEVVGAADSGDSGPDDQDVEVLRFRAGAAVFSGCGHIAMIAAARKWSHGRLPNIRRGYCANCTALLR